MGRRPFYACSALQSGSIVADQEDLDVKGINLLTISDNVAAELFAIQQNVAQLREEQEILTEVSRNRRALDASFGEEGARSQYWTYEIRRHERPDVLRRIDLRFSGAKTADEAASVLAEMLAENRREIESASKKQTTGVISTFSGETKTPPSYAEWLLKQCGSLPMIHFRENKQRIGRDEAETLLQLKVRRGGPERLDAVQQTIRALLGVHVDAFQSDDREGPRAEMDVDEFLVEANGAGIREALRIILDLELKALELVLIEEPEVHLHPGLARVLAGYLRQKSPTVQMFVTTHSTEFVDSVTFQNAYLVSRDSNKRTVTQLVSGDEGALRIPAELGLRLSAVFMFDRLVFVEGPSDEDVIRQVASKLNVDLTKNNTGFVHMGGVRNFAHFAADATLDLLTRRQVRMFFIADRDERDDDEVRRMMEKLGERANLKVLDRRELENYLLNPGAVAAFVCDKRRSAGLKDPAPDAQAVGQAITAAVESLKNEVVRLRLERRLLSPVFLNTRSNTGTIEGRLRAASELLSGRAGNVNQATEEVRQQVEQDWGRDAEALVPGADVLQAVARQYEVGFSKGKGDAGRLAALLPRSAIPTELANLIREIAGNDS